MSISNYAELAILNAVGNNTSFAVTTPYVKLHTGDPGEDGTSNAAGYVTLAVRPSSVTYTAAASLSGTGSLSASAVRTKLGAASLSGTGSLSAAATRKALAAAGLLGSGSLSATAAREAVIAAALTGTGSLTASGVVPTGWSYNGTPTATYGGTSSFSYDGESDWTYR